MILTKENIKEWKRALDKQMYKETGFPDYSCTLSDEDWIDINEGDSIQDAINSEIECWPRRASPGAHGAASEGQ